MHFAAVLSSTFLVELGVKIKTWWFYFLFLCVRDWSNFYCTIGIRVILKAVCPSLFVQVRMKSRFVWLKGTG